jgi:hypothetical protein
MYLRLLLLVALVSLCVLTTTQSSYSYPDNRAPTPVLQFKAVASKLPGVEGVLLNGLDARMKDIESLRDVHDNLEGLLAVPTYDGPLADMTGHKK